MTKNYKSLEELEAERPEDFRNPPISDEAFDAMMARNRVRSAAEDARAEQDAEEDDPEEDEEEEENEDDYDQRGTR